MNRRDLLFVSGCGLVAHAAPSSRIRFAASGFIWQNEIETGIRTTKQFGFHGLEPFRSHVMKYLDRPLDLKKQLDGVGLSLVTCSNGGPNMMTNFIDKAEAARSVADHEAFARDFIAPFGCRHFKINCGRRPAQPTTAEQLKVMAGAFNDLGKRIARYGMKLAPHPHIWSPLERESEVRQLLELTDPLYVGMVTDTAHLTLGGMDPVAIMREFYPRIAAVHFKDTEPRFKGFRGPTPTQEEHRKVNLYKNCGAGGVDFPAIFKLLNQRGYAGWITLDLDPPRPGEGTIEENLTTNKRYLVEKLGVLL